MARECRKEWNVNIHIIGLMNTKQPDTDIFRPMWLQWKNPSFSQSTQEMAHQLKPLSGAPNMRDVSGIAVLTDWWAPFKSALISPSYAFDAI